MQALRLCRRLIFQLKNRCFIDHRLDRERSGPAGKSNELSSIKSCVVLNATFEVMHSQ